MGLPSVVALLQRVENQVFKARMCSRNYVPPDRRACSLARIFTGLFMAINILRIEVFLGTLLLEQINWKEFS